MVSTHFLQGAVALLAAAGFASAQGDFDLGVRTSGFKSCDALTNANLGHILRFPGQSEYSSSVESYWAGNNRDLRPWCILQPHSTDDVSRALKALSSVEAAGNWDVAVRGAGHSSWGSSNVGRGVTIDLRFLNSSSWAPCSQSKYKALCTGGPVTNGFASIGGGSNWGQAMTMIEVYNQTAAGGREGQVGVGGLTTGGGLSFHTSRRGTAADNMVNFEVVLANGSVVNANADQNADLFKAIKGGGNNFGIVTRFDMRTFNAAPGGMYGGLVFTDFSQRNLLLNQFTRLVDINENNKADTQVVTFTYSSPGPITAAVVMINTDGVENSTSFQPLDDMPYMIKDVRRRSYGDIINTYVQAGGPRSVWFSMTFNNKFDIMDRATHMFEHLVQEAEAAFPNGGWGLNQVLQPLPKHVGQTPYANNVLGLNTTLKKNSVVWLVMGFAPSIEIEQWLNAKVANLATQLEAYVDLNGATNAWRYLNYVNPEQNPLASYGAANVKFMKTVAAKYDPNGFFQKRVTGGFKISRVN